MMTSTMAISTKVKPCWRRMVGMSSLLGEILVCRDLHGPCQGYEPGAGERPRCRVASPEARAVLAYLADMSRRPGGLAPRSQVDRARSGLRRISRDSQARSIAGPPTTRE